MSNLFIHVDFSHSLMFFHLTWMHRIYRMKIKKLILFILPILPILSVHVD